MATFILLRTLAYVLLLSAGLWLNRRDPKMLTLTVVVGVSIFLPVPPFETAAAWYTYCFVAEVAVAAVAFALATRASPYIVAMCVSLDLMHLVGIFIGPSPGFGPYRIGVPILECAELAACVMMSTPVFTKFYNVFHNCDGTLK